MRVISGLYKGRKLRGPRGLDLRPTGDRLKETVFNILGPGLQASVFLDAFSGTGSIGIEALSRGAREVVFIENGREGISLIRQNLEICGIAAGFRLLAQDIFTALRSLGRERFSADTVYLDPPYNWQPYQDLIETLVAVSVIGPSSRVVLEHHRKSSAPETGIGYRLTRRVRQGDNCLSFYAVSDDRHEETSG
jgi:16S rRNA (guanine(966)-N(2))-methyltransferase RsmD